jgi:hypothetical protein
VISTVSSNVTGISSVGTSDGLVSSISGLTTISTSVFSEVVSLSEKTEVEIVVKPDVEETKLSEIPTEEIPVTFEETVEITTEEKETPSEKTEVEIVVKEQKEDISLEIVESKIKEVTSVEEADETRDKVETTISIDVEESQREGFEISISTGEFHVPEIIKELTSLKIAEGNELVLTVEYVSQPESVVTWFIDDLPIEQPEYEITVEKTVTKLVISETSPEDEGEYKVVIENEAGKSTTTCFVNVIRKY